jgi:predicted O-methyltransferase YrrM
MPLRRIVRRFIKPILRLHPDYEHLSHYPPGHFHSPLVTPKQFLADEKAYLDPEGLLWKHVDLRPDVQRKTLEEMTHIPPLEFPKEKTPDWRYYANNSFFGYGSAAVLVAMIDLHRPKRIIEVGSGFSSAAMLDAAERRGWDTQFTFIEPRPRRLKILLRPADHAKARIIEQPLQNIGLDAFQQLEANDLLFIDSSHVAKPGSDLVELFCRIIPSLKPGCLLHFHDIFYPQTYPREWFLQGISWNETFLLRAFLLFNDSFKVLYFNPYAQQVFRDILEAWDPRVAASAVSSIWIQRVA